MASLRDDISQLNESLQIARLEMETEKKKKEVLAKKAAGRSELKETQGIEPIIYLMGHVS